MYQDCAFDLRPLLLHDVTRIITFIFLRNQFNTSELKIIVRFKKATKSHEKVFSGFRKWNYPPRILLLVELFLHLEWWGREKRNIARGVEEDARGVKKRRWLLAIKHGVSPALRIMPQNADNWLNRTTRDEGPTGAAGGTAPRDHRLAIPRV